MSQDQRRQGGLSPRTLLIAAASSAAAAAVIPMIWRPGTIFAAAATPIIVALVSELLRKPVETVSTARVRRVTKRGNVAAGRRADEPFDPLAPPPTEELETLRETVAPPRVVRKRKRLSERQWKLVLATGLIAFAAVAVLFTASELLAGDAVSGGGKRTTFFGGSTGKSDSSKSDSGQEQDRGRSPDATAAPEPTETPTPTGTPTPTPTATPTPGATPPPASGPPPAQPTPAP